MTPRASYYLEIVRTIGAPLITHVLRQSDIGDTENQAKKVAEKLSQSVETGIKLTDLIDPGTMDKPDDSLRLAMTALASDLLSETGDKKISEESLKNCVTATLGFADNFTPDALNTQRLQDLAAKGQIVDFHQIHVQYLHAFLPVVVAVQDFAFGQPAAKLMTDIANRLSVHAGKIAKTLSDSDDPLEQKRIALGVTEALCRIYTTVHRNETAKIKEKSDTDHGNVTIDTVWSGFNQTLELVKILADSMTGKQDDTGVSKKTNTPDKQPAPTPEPVSEPVPAENNAPEIPADSPPPNANPMQMFAKKPDNGETDTPPPSSAMPEKTEPPTPPKSEPAEDNEDSDGTQSGNPMSFFKTPPADE